MASLDADAIARIHDGFLAGREEAIRAVQGWVEAVVRGGNWKFSDPEGMTQEILIRLLELVRAGKVHTPGGFLKMARTTARYRCVDAYYAQRRRRERESPDEWIETHPAAESDPGRGLEERERAQALVYIFQRLSQGCRDLWRRIYQERQTADAAASALGITAGNLRVRLHRCLKRAREIQQEYEAYQP